jgi:hypothetical protein
MTDKTETVEETEIRLVLERMNQLAEEIIGAAARMALGATSNDIVLFLSVSARFKRYYPEQIALGGHTEILAFIEKVEAELGDEMLGSAASALCLENLRRCAESAAVIAQGPEEEEDDSFAMIEDDVIPLGYDFLLAAELIDLLGKHPAPEYFASERAAQALVRAISDEEDELSLFKGALLTICANPRAFLDLTGLVCDRFEFENSPNDDGWLSFVLAVFEELPLLMMEGRVIDILYPEVSDKAKEIAARILEERGLSLPSDKD